MLSTLKSMFLALYPLNTNVTIGKNPENWAILERLIAQKACCEGNRKRLYPGGT